MYEDVTYEVILKRMLDHVSDKFDKREGSVIWDSHSPAAIELQILYLELDTILREAYGDTASREFLVRRCRERGIVPYEATCAVLKGTFTPSDIDVTGKRFNIGSVNYKVLELIADGEYRVQCEMAGAVGNQQFGSMIPMDYITGLETAELTELLIPGEEEEDTEDLRKRYFTSFNEKAFGGNRQDYLEKTNAIPGVGSTKVKRCWNQDIRPADLLPGETVSTWYQGVTESLDPEVAHWLSAVYTAAISKKLTTGGTVLLTILNSDFSPASEDLVRTVQNALDPDEKAGEGYGLAPIGHIVKVQSVQGRQVKIKTELTFETGYSWINLQTAINTSISDYLLELRRSWEASDYLVVRLSQIEMRLLSIKGIVDVRNTTINEISENLVLGQYEVPMLGGISAW